MLKEPGAGCVDFRHSAVYTDTLLFPQHTSRALGLTLPTRLLLLIARKGRQGIGNTDQVVALAKQLIEVDGCPPSCFGLSNQTKPYHSLEVREIFDRMLDELGVPKVLSANTRLSTELVCIATLVASGHLSPRDGLLEIAPLSYDLPDEGWILLVQRSYDVPHHEWELLKEAGKPGVSGIAHQLEKDIRAQAELTLSTEPLDPWAARILSRRTER